MVLSLVEISKDDANLAIISKRIADITVAAFRPNIKFQELLPSEMACNDYRVATEQYTLLEIKVPHTTVLVIKDSTSIDVDLGVIAYATWVRTGEGIVYEKDDDGWKWPESCNMKVANEWGGLLFSGSRKTIGNDLHLRLDFVATDLAYTKKGAGGMLVHWGVQQARKEGISAYLESTSSGRRVYEKYGFKAVEEFRIVFEGTGDSGEDVEYVETAHIFKP